MAEWLGNGTVRVQSGDTLWAISKFVLSKEGVTKPTEVQINNKIDSIASLNSIKDRNLIYAGQVLKISTSSSSSSKTGSNAPVIQTIGIQSGTSRTVFATWTWEKHVTTKEYQYEWYYDTGDSLEWFHGGGPTSCGTRQHQTFEAPTNAKRVKFMVKPIAKNEGEN